MKIFFQENRFRLFVSLSNMNYRFIIASLLIILSLSSCRKDLETSSDPSLQLSFSNDTVFFDTVFTTIGTTTKRLKIYNRAKNAVNISKIDLVEQTAFASYRLNVDGIAGNHLRDIEIPANDSIFAFVEVTVNTNASNIPFIISDSIMFETNGNRQKVDVVAYGENANFYRDSVLTGNIRFTNDKPYVIFGGILIDTLSKLTIDPGCRIYLHKDAIILAKGTIEVNGTKNDSVTFQGDRREQQYYNEPGQWSGIQFLPGSVNNLINYACIKGSVFGVIAGTLPLYGITPEVKITNSIIKYSQVTGIFGIAAKLKSYNNLIFACGQYGVFTQFGGEYDFIHNTIALTNFDMNRDNPAVLFTDYVKANNVFVGNNLVLNFRNNIVTGTGDDEYYIDSKHTTPAQTSTEYNMLKTKQNWSNTNLRNLNPQFVDPSLSLINNYTENYRLKSSSALKSAAAYLNTPPEILSDADGVLRANPASMGCYE